VRLSFCATRRQGAALLRPCTWVISPAGDRTSCPEPARVVASAPCRWHSQWRDGAGTLAADETASMPQQHRSSTANAGAAQLRHLCMPVCPGHCHAILDQRPASHFDPPGRHGTTHGEIGIAMRAAGILAQGMRPRRAGDPQPPVCCGRATLAKACTHPQI